MINPIKNQKYLPDVVSIKIGNCKKIGIFGGSFNPAHQGHLYVSNESIKRLNLDILYWLITPQNPNKNNYDTLSLKQRVILAKKISEHNPKIKIITLEESFYFHYTFLTLKFINKIKNPFAKIFWIMGEDNLYNFHLFKQWQHIIESCTIAVFARNKKSFMTLCQKSSIIYKNILNKEVKFFLIPTNPLSSTQIRIKQKEKRE
jgi:nicotinate-nucleotide adenylyltransferase